MTQQRLSGTIVVIIIAIGVQACIIVFIFVKRQVQRFALRNRRGPHMSVGHGAPKALRREADRLLAYVSDIRHEPPLQGSNVPSLSSSSSSSDPHHQLDYRAQIVVNFQAFESELADFGPNYIRPAGGNVRSHLLGCMHGGGPLAGAVTKLVQQVCDDYDAARHHYEPIDRQKCKVFIERLDRLRAVVRANKLVRPVQPLAMNFAVNPRSAAAESVPIAAAAAPVRQRKSSKLPSESKDLDQRRTPSSPSAPPPAAVCAVSSIVSVDNQSVSTTNQQANVV